MYFYQSNFPKSIFKVQTCTYEFMYRYFSLTNSFGHFQELTQTFFNSIFPLTDWLFPNLCHLCSLSAALDL